LAVPRDVYPIVAATCPPEVMPRPLDDLPSFDALAIGPGMGQKPETQKLIWKILTGTAAPTVVDADALNALATARAASNKLRRPVSFFTGAPAIWRRRSAVSVRCWPRI